MLSLISTIKKQEHDVSAVLFFFLCDGEGWLGLGFRVKVRAQGVDSGLGFRVTSRVTAKIGAGVRTRVRVRVR